MAKIQIEWSKLTPLTKTNIAKLNGIGGVYRLSKKKEDGKFYVFFVGSAEDLKERLSKHLSENEENAKLQQYLKQEGDFAFKYAKITEASIRGAIEKQLYKYYLPELNNEEPKSALDIEANIN